MGKRKVYSIEPDYAVSPGDMILDRLEDRGMTQVEFAKRMGMTTKHVNKLIKSTSAMTDQTAIMVARVLGGTPEQWMRIRDLYIKRKMFLDENLEAHKAILQIDAIKDLKKRGYLAPYETPAEGVDAVLRFFQFSNVDALCHHFEHPSMSLRHSTKYQGDPIALASWLQIGVIEARKIDCKDYNEDLFKKALATIRQKTREWTKGFLSELQTICANCGVAVVLVPQFKNDAVYGATQWLTPQKAMIVMNFRHKFNDIFWFSFFHEVGHILLGSKKKEYIDYGKNDDETVSPEESKADEFARDFLIPPSEVPSLRNLKSKKDVQDFAARLGIHPAIVVGRLQHDNLIPRSYYLDLRSKFNLDSV